MPKNKSIKLPNDQETINDMVNVLGVFERISSDDAVFLGISEKEREALVLSIRRAAKCARNVRISLKGR